MNGMRISLPAVMAVLLGALPCLGQESVNGYTYIAPTVYPAPPVVVYDPAMIIPTPVVIRPWSYYPVHVLYAEPAFVSQTTVPYDPVWNYPPPPAPVGVRERIRYGRHGIDYKYQEFAPGGAPIYSYRVDSDRRGYKIRERVR